MTYITQATIDFATAARHQFRDSYDWHQAVWRAFPGQDGEARRFLTRLDRQRDGFRLLIVSPVAPVRPEWCPPGDENWKTKAIPETYFSRTKYVFQLCANPTKKVAKQLADGGLAKNGRRAPLVSRDDLVAWIHRKGAEGGFAVDETTLRTFSRGREYFIKNGQAGLHSAVEFQGVLAVTDPQTFHEAFARGIGSAKAFGFGLLVIAPVS
jgi:CRISPR system Cascade subunit CasE